MHIGALCMIKNYVGSRIRELRNQQGISQEKLALKAEIDRTYIAGKRNISIVALEKLLLALDITFSDFFKDI